MRRRQFIAAIGAIGATLTTRGRAQEPGRTYRLGSLFASPRDAPHHIALFDKLRHAGFAEGRNLIVDWSGFGLQVEQFDEHAAELVKSGVDLISAGGEAAVRAAQGATSQIPILGLADDMVGQGFVRSLARPGGNTTGVTLLASDLDGKRQEILIQAVPGVRRIAALADVATDTSAHLRMLEVMARDLGVELLVHSVGRPDDIGPAIDAAHASDATALNVLASALLFNNRTIIFDRAASFHMPAVYQWPEMAHQGGLIGYGPSIVQLSRDVLSHQLTSLLRGARPADLPVQQPTRFELVVNLKTATVLGLTLPATVLARADEVIE